jgi:microcystin-dependent protein
MKDSTMEKLKSDALQQVWSPSDLDPDVLEAEISKMFSYNQSETERHNDSKMYFNGNVEQMKQSAAKGSSSISGSIGLSFLKVFSFGMSASSETSATTTSKNHTITDQVMSETDIQKHLSQHAMETEWKGKKLRPKEFKVYKLSDITDHLQIAVISKQLSVDKEQNAIVRIISTMNTPYSIPTNHTASNLIITGEIRLYSGISEPPYPWLLCDGSAVSRIEYKRLFAVIDTRYGPGDSVTTFNLPDFRGRVPVGVDQFELRVKQVTEAGMSGGAAAHTLTVAQLPSHQHTQGSLAIGTAGSHTHSIYDPGHNHGGSTGSAKMGAGDWGMKGSGGGSDIISHSHTIYTGQTGISIYAAGDHNHTVSGNTGSVGNDSALSLLQPYQSVNYIIYAD